MATSQLSQTAVGEALLSIALLPKRSQLTTSQTRTVVPGGQLAGQRPEHPTRVTFDPAGHLPSHLAGLALFPFALLARDEHLNPRAGEIVTLACRVQGPPVVAELDSGRPILGVSWLGTECDQ